MANKKNNKKEEVTEKKNATNKQKNENKKVEEKRKSAKEEVVEKEAVIESPIKSGMSETTRGMIIGMLIMGLISAIIILLILGKNDGKLNGGSNKNPSGVTTNMTEKEKFDVYFGRKEATLIVFAREGCGWCSYQEPIVERIGEMYDLDYLFMNIENLTSTEMNEVSDKLQIGDGGTPTSVIVKDGKVVTSLGGMSEGKEYVEFLVKGGVLPKGSTYKDEENLIRIDYDKVLELVKGKETSVILFDIYASNKGVCGITCLDQRKLLSEIAKENNIPIYHYHANDADSSKFIDKLGDWGYDIEDYKEKQSVRIPLLMFVKNGKLEWFQNGNMTEDDIRNEMKKYNIIK